MVATISSSTVYSVEADETQIAVGKIEPEFREKIQELKPDGATENVSLIIWLSENQAIMNMSVEDLKIYVPSLLTNEHGASVYGICRALPVIMATVCVDEVESITTYDFFEHVGDGNKRAYLTLDVSRKVIRANSYLEDLGGYNGSGLNTVIIDSGINSTHPDLDDLDDDPDTNDPKVIQEISFVDWNNDGLPDVDPMDNWGHGTHVAGIVAGTGEASGYQYVGVAPGAWLWNYKAFDIDGRHWDHKWQRWVPTIRGERDDIVNAIDNAIAEGADIINLSFAIETGGNGNSDESRAADRAVKNGIVVIACAGNEGPDPQTITSPGDAFDVITVGAIDDNNTQSIDDDVLADASSRGPTGDDRTKPDIMAPGINIIAPMDQGSTFWQTFPELRVGNSYASDSGTSSAAPHVAGIAALILQAHPHWGPKTVKCAIKGTNRLNDNLAPLSANDRGTGIVDTAGALTCGMDLSVEAESGETGGYGDYHAVANLGGSYEIYAQGRPGDAQAVATLKKSFVPDRNISNPAFFFNFYDKGYMETAVFGWANLKAILELWSGETPLFQYESDNIHYIGSYQWISTSCTHEINYTYEGQLLAGENYTIEYGFSTFAHLASADFYYGNHFIAALQLTVISGIGVRNPSFEQRIQLEPGVYGVQCWSNSTPHGWRELKGDANEDRSCNWKDQLLLSLAYGSRRGDSNYDWRVDFNGDGKVDWKDVLILSRDYGATATCKDGSYSWYITRRGVENLTSINLTQWLCDFDVNAMKGKNVTFTFWFKPELVGIVGYAFAKIFYINETGEELISSYKPFLNTTWNILSVTAAIPEDTIAIKVIIHCIGVNYKVRIDKASLSALN